MNRIALLTICCMALVLGCKKKDPPRPPESATLVFPELNSECTTGTVINTTTANVEFRWSASNHTETYELNVKNLRSGNTQKVSTAELKAVLPLERGVAFSWFVNSKNSKVTEAASSATWHFFNAGDVTTYPPFPATIETPSLGASVFKDANNEVELLWQGGDLDNDITGYDLYFSTENPPGLLVSVSSNVNGRKVSVMANTVYYWKVITRDAEGNTSDTGVYDFRVY